MKWKKGFTYIELILYILIVSVFVGGIILLAWDAIYIQIRSHEAQAVSNNLRILSARISYEVRNSDGINDVTQDNLSLSMSDPSRNPTVFSLSNGAVYMGFGSSGVCPVSNPCRLTGNDVNVTNLQFEDLSDVASGAEIIKYTISLESTNNKQNVKKTGSVSSSVEVRSKYGP